MLPAVVFQGVILASHYVHLQIILHLQLSGETVITIFKQLQEITMATTSAPFEIVAPAPAVPTERKEITINFRYPAVPTERVKASPIIGVVVPLGHNWWVEPFYNGALSVPLGTPGALLNYYLPNQKLPTILNKYKKLLP